jgi:Uncharacterized conserved protein
MSPADISHRASPALHWYIFYILNQIIMPVAKLVEFLNTNNIKFVSIRHSKAYTANEIAHSAHIHGQELAKTVVIRVNGKMALAVLPASGRVHPDMLKEAIGAETVSVCNEREFLDKFSGCELGAMPPFGNLYGMDVYVSTALTEDKEIAFNAGTLTELIRLSYKDFENLVKPKIVRF